jgi:hypothetical protein
MLKQTTNRQPYGLRKKALRRWQWPPQSTFAIAAKSIAGKLTSHCQKLDGMQFILEPQNSQ